MRLSAGLPLMLIALAGAAQPGEASFHGYWRIEAALAAPWADPGHTMKNTGEDTYLGQVVEIGDSTMKGPALLGCGKTEFALEELPFSGLFEGGLATDPTNPALGQSPDRARSKALALGFSTEPVLTLFHGCSEIPLHLKGRDTILFALDNRIYVMAREP